MMMSNFRVFGLIPSVSKVTRLDHAVYCNRHKSLHTLRTTVSAALKSPKLLTAVTPLDKQARLYSEDTKVTALTVLKDLKHLKSSPTPALVLGASGVLPFLAPPLYMGLTGSFVASLAYSQVAYGAVILSFVGAVRWGIALSRDGIVSPNWLNLGYSVSPSLVAWVALMMPTTLALSTLIVGLCGATYMDITMFGYPSWFKAMRFLLTITAVLSLWTTLVFKYILSDSAKQARANAKSLKENKTEKVDLSDAANLSLKEIESLTEPVLEPAIGSTEVKPIEDVILISDGEK